MDKIMSSYAKTLKQTCNRVVNCTSSKQSGNLVYSKKENQTSLSIYSNSWYIWMLWPVLLQPVLLYVTFMHKTQLAEGEM